MMPRMFCFVAFAKCILLATLALFLTKYSYSLQLKICKVTSLVCLFFFFFFFCYLREFGAWVGRRPYETTKSSH